MTGHGTAESPLSSHERWLVILISFLVALSFGLSFGDRWSNQSVYLIEGLRLVDPTLLKNDWWVTELTHVHIIFPYLVAALESINFLKWGLATLNIASIMIGLGFLYLLFREIAGRQAFFLWLVFLILFIGISRANSVATSYLFSPAFQPSCFSSAAYIAGIYYFVKRQFSYSGIWLAAAGVMHTNYLLLAFVLFGTGHLFLNWNDLIIRCVKQFLAPIIIFLLQFPQIAYLSGFDLPWDLRREAFSLYMDTLPFHHRPLTFLPSFIPLIGWQLMALPFLYRAIPNKQTAHAFAACYLGFLTILGLSTVLTTAVFIDDIGRLFMLRMAPFLLLFTQIIVSMMIADIFLNQANNTMRFSDPKRMAIVALGYILVVGYAFTTKPLSNPDLWVLLIGGLCVFGAWFWKWHNLSSWLALKTLWPKERWLIILMLCLVAFVSIGSDARKNTYNLVCEKCGDRQEAKLYDWARTKTGRDSLFLIPVFDLKGMRLLGERAVVVDWKAIPMRPDEIPPWHDRLSEIGSFYERPSRKALKNILEKYPIDYVVLPANFDREDIFDNYRAGSSYAFKNRAFRVLSLSY